MRYVYILGLLSVSCNRMADRCCENKVIFNKVDLCFNEVIKIGDNIKYLIQEIPSVKVHYDEGLEDFYGRCPGDRVFYDRDSLLVNDDKDLFMIESTYFFCDSLLYKAVFEFRTEWLYSDRNMQELIFRNYPCFNDEMKSRINNTVVSHRIDRKRFSSSKRVETVFTIEVESKQSFGR